VIKLPKNKVEKKERKYATEMSSEEIKDSASLRRLLARLALPFWFTT
jgi:hypothetical protein